jgi:uncharacterized protein YprB with RNaseH-like and TPR domain
MLTATFVHAQGVGFATERGLWDKGARSWTGFLDRKDGLGLSRRLRESLVTTVEASAAAHERGDIGYFARAISQREHWRATAEYPSLGYLDIETDGGIGADSVTVIGLSDGFDCKTYIKGEDLNDFPADCLAYEGFVTFFGAGFDIPMLKRRFPSLEPVFRDRFHIDLCPTLRRLGFRGGLKSIERQLGISRVPEADGLDGMDAVRLWQAYTYGGRDAEEALRLLVAYNREDVVNMKTLLDFALPKLRIDSGFDGG